MPQTQELPMLLPFCSLEYNLVGLPDVRRFSTLRNRIDISPIGAARKGVLFDTDLLAHKLNGLSNLAKEARVVLRRRITRECEDVL